MSRVLICVRNMSAVAERLHIALQFSRLSTRCPMCSSESVGKSDPQKIGGGEPFLVGDEVN